MPDWSYRTVFRPLLFRLPFGVARDLCLAGMGTLADLPLGGGVIDFLGHMRPDPRLRTPLGPLELASPVVIGPHFDCKLLAPRALSRFGVGMIEVGPVAASIDVSVAPIERDDTTASLRRSFELATCAADGLVRNLAHARLSVPVLVRLGADVDASTIAQLAPYAAAFAVDLEAFERSEVAAAVRGAGAILFVVAPADLGSELPALLVRGVAAGVTGIVIDGRVLDPSGQGWLVGGAALESATRAVATVRQSLGPDFPIVAGGAVDPAGAMALLGAGANAVQTDAGLVHSGPGLCKRINDAALFVRCADRGTPSRAFTTAPSGPQLPTPDYRLAVEPLHTAAMSWFWAMMLAVAMLIGGTLALGIAATRVLLPYDEAYLGMTADDLRNVNPRLIDFMTHDRVTLAGTMLAIAMQYLFLSWFGIRRGLHWAKVALLASAFSGFFTFFLFLGFGYFDPFHAFVTAINFQFVLLALQGRLAVADPPAYPGLNDDWRWRLAQWGQLLLIVQAAALIVAGLTICTVGSTSVFVPEDLEFMDTTAEALRRANPRLIPVVAHDRASFGGMLLAVGIATLLPALWGIRQGATWLWWMFALAGSIGYLTTLVVHLQVGYVDPMHLAPAFAGLALLWLSLSLLFPYMKPPSVSDIEQWNALLNSARSGM
jgi:hypothetical protein